MDMVSQGTTPAKAGAHLGGRSHPRVARRYYGLPNWAPAFAGVVLRCWTAGLAHLEFSAWRIKKTGRLPARSGPTFWSVDTPKSTPAKAGAQLGDGGIRVARRYHGLPNWAPASAGVVLGIGSATDIHPRHGERKRPPNLSVRAGRRRGVAASGGGRGGAAGPDRRDRNARRSRGSPGSPCHHKSGNRARRDGRAAICRCGR